MKRLILAAAFLLPSALSFAAVDASDEELEICVSSGQCALRVHAEGFEQMIYLIKAEDMKLRSLWTGASFYVVDQDQYQKIRGWLPEESLILPPVNASADFDSVYMQLQATTTPKTGGGSVTGGGPLIGGNITVTVGGGSCSDCHKGSMSEIHKEVLKPKPDGGK